MVSSLLLNQLPARSDLEKALRDFNDLEDSGFSQTLTRVSRSKGLADEVFYYLNVPQGVEDLFPLFFEFSADLTSYRLERVHGATASAMYVAQEFVVGGAAPKEIR